MKVTLIPIEICAIGTVTKGLIEGLEDLEIRGQAENYPNNNIVEIGQNTEISPGDFRRLVITQTPVKGH